MVSSSAWPLFLVMTAAVIVADDSDMVCPGLEAIHLSPQCISEEVACSSKSVWESASSVCGMCDGCKNYLQPDEACQVNNGLPCKPGYKCDENTLVCKIVKCSCQDLVDRNYYVSWTPRCNGVEYLPVQCKGEKPIGRCFCFDKNGKRLFGEKPWSEADNMTCACSVRVQELKDSGRKDVTLHCNDQGNYEEVQCDDGVCWCAEEKTGLPTSRILPENMMIMLPCYNETEIGSSYLRKCESLMIAQKKIEIEMEAHNSLEPNFPYTNCDLDGGYGAVQQEGNQLFCAWKDKTRIGGYASELSGFSSMDCRCARDKFLYTNIQQTCLGNGNYNILQYNNNGDEYCVDSDGYVDPTKCTDAVVVCQPPS